MLQFQGNGVFQAEGPVTTHNTRGLANVFLDSFVSDFNLLLGYVHGNGLSYF